MIIPDISSDIHAYLKKKKNTKNLRTGTCNLESRKEIPLGHLAYLTGWEQKPQVEDIFVPLHLYKQSLEIPNGNHES